MASKLVKLARALSELNPIDAAFVKEYAKLLGGEKVVAPRKKRKYTRRAKAVEVAPGVSVVKRGRKKKALSGEIDHSPRSVEEQ